MRTITVDGKEYQLVPTNQADQKKNHKSGLTQELSDFLDHAIALAEGMGSIKYDEVPDDVLWHITVVQIRILQEIRSNLSQVHIADQNDHSLRSKVIASCS
ncbi:MAG: hypothetical protein JKX76_03085 [Colwellia sp.]|nr:hypothetical protein [Colwellia sp.]